MKQLIKNLSLKFIIFIILIGMSAVSIFSQDNGKKSVSIGIVLDGKWEGDNEALKILKEEINFLLSEEYNVLIPDNKILSGDWNIERIKQSITQLMNDPETDIIIALGETVSQIAQSESNLTKPVVATVILNPTPAEALEDKSINKNLNRIFILPSLTEQIPVFKSLYDFNKAAVLLSELYFNDSVNDFISKVKKNETGTELSFVLVGSDINKALTKIPVDVQAVIIEPLRFLSYRQFNLLTEKLKQKNLPVFTVFDEKYVNGDVLAGFVPKEFFPRLSRRVAINIQRILSGEVPTEIPSTFPLEDELVINMKTARDFKIYPSWSLVTDSRLINDKTEQPGRTLTLSEVTKEALDANLDLLAQYKNVEAGEEDVTIARSYLLPQLKSSLTGLLVDKDKAETSFGLQAEKSIYGTMTLNQIIYDEKTWANLSINESQQIIREYELEQEKLDITLESAVAYLNVMRAKNYEKIQNENLARTKANLQIANYRYSVGSGRLTETYRWENELATNKKSVIEANSNRNLAEINLNRLLNRPLEEHFVVSEEDISELIGQITDANLSKYLENKWYFKSLRNFAVEEGLKHSPEVKIIDEAITIQERVETSNTNSLFIPTLALQGQLNNTFYKGGAGSEGMNLNIPSVNLEFPEQEDFYWTVGLNLSFNLYDGGAKFAELEKSQIELSKLTIEKQSLVNSIEQNVRSSLHQTGSSFAGIEEANKSSVAANKNLELVVNAYSTGSASIVDLIDAQNSALVSDQLAVDAVYDFLIDLLNVERAMGRFYYSLNEDERKSVHERLEEYIQNNLEY